MMCLLNNTMLTKIGRVLPMVFNPLLHIGNYSQELLDDLDATLVSEEY